MSAVPSSWSVFGNAALYPLLLETEYVSVGEQGVLGCTFPLGDAEAAGKT
jgi:hypothetical protein